MARDKDYMNKLFTEKQIAFSAILGGPIPPGILFYLNYRRIDKEKEANVSLAVTLAFTTALFFTLMRGPAEIIDKIPNSFLTAIYGILVYLAYRAYLAKDIGQKLAEGAEKESNWTVAGVIALGMAINIALIFTLAFSAPAFDGEKVTYGKIKNEVYYNPALTSQDDVNKLANLLIETGFFTDDGDPVAVHLEMLPSGSTVTFQIDNEYWEAEDVKSYFGDLKIQLEVLFLRDATVVLESYDMSGKRSEKQF